MKLAIELAGSSARRATGSRPDRYSVPMKCIRLLDELGWDVVFSSESLGPDGLTPLGYVLALTRQIGVGTSAVGIAARTPATTAMSMQTLLALAGPGRDVVLTVSSGYAKWVEGWHGASYSNPYGRMRDYVEIVKKVLAGAVVDHDGRCLKLPYDGADRLADGEVFRSGLITDSPIPVLIGGGSEKMIELAAEVADGLNPMSFAPGMMNVYRPIIERGFARAGRPLDTDFEVWAHVDFSIVDDVAAGLYPFKEFVARLIAMQAGNRNVYRQQLILAGMSAELERIEGLQADGQTEAAVQAVPDEYVDEHFLVGPLPRVLSRARRWADSGLTGLIVRPGASTENANGYEDLEAWRALTEAFRG